MNNIFKLLCLAILPSLSFATDQAPSIDFSAYSLTQKVLTAYFKANKSTVSQFSNTIHTKPDGAEITVFKPKPKDSVVDFTVVSYNTDLSKFAPPIRNTSASLMLVSALHKKVSSDESLLSLIDRKLTGSVDKDRIFKKHWLDNGIACQFNKHKEIYCHGSIPRELFDAMKKNAEKVEAMKQQANNK